MSGVWVTNFRFYMHRDQGQSEFLQVLPLGKTGRRVDQGMVKARRAKPWGGVAGTRISQVCMAGVDPMRLLKKPLPTKH